MTDHPSESSTAHRKKLALAAWLQSGPSALPEPGPEEVLRTPAPSISDELEQLLWLYADDLTTDAQEERMWRLAAEEPGARSYFARMHAAEQIVSRAERKEAEPSVAAAAPAVVRAAAWPTAQDFSRLPGVAVRLAGNQLRMTRRSGQAVAGQYAVARSTGEPVTRLSDEQTLSCGTLKVDVSRRPNGRFDVSLSLSHLVPDVDADSLSVQLLANETIVSESALTSAGVRFRELEARSYVIVLSSVTGLLDRFVIDIESP